MPNADDGLPPNGPALQQAFEALVTILNERQIRYAIIGGLAVLQHTRARTTDDVDVLLTVPQTAMPGLFESLRDRGFSVELSRNIRELRDEGLTCLRFMEVMIDLMRPLIPAYAGNLDLDFIRAEMDHFTTADDPRREWFENSVRQASRLRE